LLMKCLPCASGFITIIARYSKKALSVLCCFAGQQAERYLISLIHTAVKRDSYEYYIQK